MPQSIPLPRIKLDTSLKSPLFVQVHDALRDSILSGAIRAGMRLPPSRVLASALGVSRQTIVTAYEQLTLDGYLVAHVGRGSFVSSALPIAADRSGARPVTGSGAPALHRQPSRRGLRYAPPERPTVPTDTGTHAFRTGLPALEIFPYATWARLEGRHWRRRPDMIDDPAGFAPLRQALAERLRATRGMTCDPEQILVTTGTQQGLHLIATLLLDAGDAVWMENPGYRWAKAILSAAGAELCPVPVDRDGLRVADGIDRFPHAKLAYVTPSHQFPLGATMSLQRRLELLAWARRDGAWIVEDDYDSEYRYDSPVLASLQSMDRSGCVLFLGTFSKVLFPGLQLGYIVVPPALVDLFKRGKALIDRRTASMPQRVLADFIAEGHFQRHIKRTRALYDERRQVLLDVVRTRLGGGLEPGPFNAGMQIALAFKGKVDDVEFARLAAERNLSVLPLSVCYAPRTARGYPPASGLLLGFACVPPHEIRHGVEVLQQMLETGAASA
ncbi:hypothetical protein HR51_03185 [Burkholderia cepacia]|nr:hypothetical protein HR51_03185 [Burkholderia cepacia]